MKIATAITTLALATGVTYGASEFDRLVDRFSKSSLGSDAQAIAQEYAKEVLLNDAEDLGGCATTPGTTEVTTLPSVHLREIGSEVTCSWTTDERGRDRWVVTLQAPSQPGCVAVYDSAASPSTRVDCDTTDDVQAGGAS